MIYFLSFSLLHVFYTRVYSGVYYGYNIGNIAASTRPLQLTFGFSDDSASLIPSMLILGGFFGSLSGGTVSVICVLQV